VTEAELTVVLGDDHAVVREGTRHMLERDHGIRVIGEAELGAQAVQLAAELKPDIVLLDVALPDINGIEATRQIRELPDPPYVLLLSAYDDRDYVTAAIDAGASGYLTKTAAAQDVIAAIRAVLRGEVVLGPGLVRQLAARPPTDHQLSNRELEIIRLAARGMGNRQIAEALAISSRTVEVHFTGVFNKLGVANRTEAIAVAALRGWLADRSGALP
jgi:two-component system, NarL family, response regulator LiaR